MRLLISVLPFAIPVAPFTIPVDSLLGDSGVLSASTVSPRDIQDCSPATTVAVTFNELVATAWGDSVFLVGSIPQLGNWSPSSGVALSANNYTADNPLWRLITDLPPGISFEYKYIRVKADGSVFWEEDPNHSYIVPSGCTNASTVDDSWQSSGPARSSSNSSSSAVPTCTHGPSSRNCWSDGLTVDTDFDKHWPSTGRTVSYHFNITNTTLAPDGYSRMVLAINGEYPGPTVYADWGDNISVTVTNQMQDNGTGIHWHGMRQFHSNNQDGVPGVTECPIAPGQSKTYTFQSTQYGTSWYHSHFSNQYGDGILGAIVVHGPATANYDIDLGPLPITDWYYPTVGIHAARVEHEIALPPEADNGLINGSMTSAHGGAHSKTTLTQGKTHRLRLINTAVDNHFMISLDGHNFTVISADFVPVVPYNTSWIFVGIGQRYDVLVNADQAPGAYWLRAEAQDRAGCGSNFNNGNIKAIMAYEGYESDEPTTSATSYAQRCTDETQLVPHWNSYVPPTTAPTFNNLSSAINDSVQADGSINVYWQINSIPMRVDWTKPTLSYVNSSNSSYPSSVNAIILPDEGIWSYWIIMQGEGTPYNVQVPHPIHLHGHDFYILGSGSSPWSSSDVDSLNYENPTRRDVAMLPENGWLALAFKTDNPGAWLMHCHIAWHSDEGFAVQFLESPSTINSISPVEADYNENCDAWKTYSETSYFKQSDSGI